MEASLAGEPETVAGRGTVEDDEDGWGTVEDDGRREGAATRAVLGSTAPEPVE